MAKMQINVRFWRVVYDRFTDNIKITVFAVEFPRAVIPNTHK